MHFDLKEMTMLPNKFKPKYQYNLIRLGSKHDGGYLVEKDSIYSAKTLLGFGIENDWNFERDFLAKNNIKLEAFDHTISFGRFAGKAVESLAKILICFWKPKAKRLKYHQKFNLFIDFLSFFRNDRSLHKIAIGNSIKNSKSVNRIFSEYVDQLPVFIKCDIEGSEYEILDDLIKNAENICGLAIEFHDIHLHLKQIESFLDSFPLELVHIHVNNYADVDENGDPTVIELSFAKKPISGAMQEYSLPHPKDFPNNRDAKDIIPTFED